MGAPEVINVSISFLGLLASLYLFNYVYLFLVSLGREVELPMKDVENWPLVSIHVPLYNERYVASRLIDAIASIDYPKDKLQVVIVDDSTDDTPEIVSEAIARNSLLGIEFIHIRRSSREGFKAGALQEALKHTKADYVAIFDADFVPPKDFLKKVLEVMMVEERVGAVQVRWAHINRNASPLTIGQSLNLDLHFEVEQKARSIASLFLNFNGTAGVWRRKCIEEVGGWRPYLAEDLELSIRAQLRGWRILYLNEPACPGEVPPQVQAAKKQQYRWAYGAVQVAKDYLIEILRAKVGIGVKVQAIFHVTRHFPQLIFLMVLLLTPLAIILSVPSGNALLSSIWALVTALVVTLKLGAKGLREFPYMVLFTTSMTLNNALAVIDALIGRKREFFRTPKFGEGDWRGKRYVLPLDTQSYLEIGLGLLLIVTALVSILKNFHGYAVYSTIAGTSFLYVGLLSIIHAPMAGRDREPRSLRIVKYVMIVMLILVVFFSIYHYYQTYYRLDVANGYLMRGASSADAEDIATYIERAMELLPREGNPVWLFPTPRTDFGLIHRDLSTLLTAARNLATIDPSSPTYQQGVDQLKDSLKVLRDQITEASPFYYINTTSLIIYAPWIVAFAILLWVYGRLRKRGIAP